MTGNGANGFTLALDRIDRLDPMRPEHLADRIGRCDAHPGISFLRYTYGSGRRQPNTCPLCRAEAAK